MDNEFQIDRLAGDLNQHACMPAQRRGISLASGAPVEHDDTVSRRSATKLMIAGCAALIGALSGCQGMGPVADPLAAAADSADPSQAVWDDADLNRFLMALPDAQLWSVWIAAGLAGPSDPVPANIDRVKSIEAIRAQIVWLQSSIITWIFKDNQMHYDALVRWVAKKYDVPAAELHDQTFRVEQAVMMRVFVGIWDKLTPAQRTEVLAKMDPSGALGDHAGIVVASGTVAAAALATSATLTSGLAFYTSMSVFISTTASLLGFTLPFGAYTGASALVGFLSGPVGWALIGVGALVSVAWLGAANERKCAEFVVQINVLRAASWRAAGRSLP